MWGQEKSQRGRTLDGSLASITPAPQPSMAPTAGSKPWSLARHALSEPQLCLLLCTSLYPSRQVCLSSPVDNPSAATLPPP